MSETIGEMILPGTYIDVRAEGLIGVGGIATGNVGIVGTANRGPLNQVAVFGSPSEALDTFGAADRWPDAAADQPNALSLTRTLQHLFAGGASSVYAVRIANLPAAAASTSFDVAITEGAVDTLLFKVVANSPGTWGNDLELGVDNPAAGPVTLTVVYGRIKEQFEGASAKALFDAINAPGEGSRLVVAQGLVAAEQTKRPGKIADVTPVATNGDGAGVTATEVAAGLALLESQPVNLVVVAGRDAKTVAGAVLAHLERTENDGRERLAVLGASTDEPTALINDDASKGSNPRLILVGPGLIADDPARSGPNRSVRLPASYTAALVAGRLATLAPHVSLTNKDLPISALTTEYGRAQQKRLLKERVLLVVKNLGFRVLKGITTDSGAFQQISVRRIVDYAKAGVRIGANPYIGRLNNARVRAALKATLDGFLSGMVLDEMLQSYELEVSATRAQEISGVALVSMTLRPTFSIDFVKVIMNLE